VRQRMGFIFLASAATAVVIICFTSTPAPDGDRTILSTVTRALLFHRPDAFGRLRAAEYRLLMEGPCCILDIPGDFCREFREHLQRNLVDALPEVEFIYERADEPKQWRVEIDFRLLDHAPPRNAKWPCSLDVWLGRMRSPRTLDVLHWSKRTLYLTPEDILAELDRELAKLVAKWNVDGTGQPLNESDAATAGDGEVPETE